MQVHFAEESMRIRLRSSSIGTIKKIGFAKIGWIACAQFHGIQFEFARSDSFRLIECKIDRPNFDEI